MTSRTSDLSVEEMEIMKSFFEYWDHLENFKVISEDKRKIVDQDVRNAIIDILALGIPDIDPMTEQPRKRHVLSARELLDEVNERLDNDIKKSNLYFHIQKLEDADIIKAVDQIPRGKQYITYYGRTAKGFLFPDMGKDLDKFTTLIDPNLMIALVNRIQGGSDVSAEQVVNNSYDQYSSELPRERLAEWLEKYQQDVLELEIDIRKLFHVFLVLSRFDKETVEAMREFARALDIPDFS